MGCTVSAEEQRATPNGSPAKPTPTGDGQTADYSSPENPRPPKKKRKKRSERRESATADENDTSEAAVVDGESAPTAPRLFSAERPNAARPQPGPGNDIVDAAASRNLSGSGSKHTSASSSSSQSKSSPTWTRTDVRRMTDSTNSNGDGPNANTSTADANKLRKKKKRKKSLAPPPAQLGIPAVSVLRPLLAPNVPLTEPSEDRIESPEDDPRRFSGGSIGRTSPGLGRTAESLRGAAVPDPRNPLATPPGDSPLVERGREASLLQLLNAVQQRQIKQRSVAVLRRSPCSSTSTRPISSPVPLSQSGSTAFSSSPSNDSPSMDDLLPRGDGNSGETSSNSKEEMGEEERDEVGVASAPLRPARAQAVDDVEWSVLRERGRGAPENEPLIGFFHSQ